MGNGSQMGGHKSVHPSLEIADLQRLIEEANHLGLDVALDIAFQCSLIIPI